MKFRDCIRRRSDRSVERESSAGACAAAQEKLGGAAEAVAAEVAAVEGALQRRAAAARLRATLELMQDAAHVMSKARPAPPRRHSRKRGGRGRGRRRGGADSKKGVRGRRRAGWSFGSQPMSCGT